MGEINPRRFNLHGYQKILILYTLILFTGYTVSVIAAPTLWAHNVYIVHTILELICAFISIATFLVVWNTYEKNPGLNNILGYGFLSVAVFDIFHTYFFFAAQVLDQGYPDLSFRYWIIGRLVEALILLIVSSKEKGFALNKWIMLIITLAFSIGTSLLLLYFPEILPVMITEGGLTPAKISLEYVVIALTFINLYKLRNKLDDETVVSYRYIYIALLIIIPAEFLFTLYREITSFYMIYGHILKIFYFCFIYRAVFVSTITYPYNKLDIERGQLGGKETQVTGGPSDFTDFEEQQDKMMQQEKLALLGQVSTGIVHETRNYLTTIKGSCQLIDMLTNEEVVKNYTSMIKKNIDEVNRIISEFLSLSKHREAELTEVSICDLSKSIKRIVETSFLTKDIKVEFLLSNEERYLLCDEAQIMQVVLNISKNAVEAMDGVEDARLRIEVGYDEDQDEMIIKISDNGCGMSEDTLKRIGTPFFTTKKDGTGIGLSVCFKIVQDHQGKMLVESEQGKGTSFIIKLPCAHDDEDEII